MFGRRRAGDQKLPALVQAKTTVPRFYLHIRSQDELIPDPEGTELPEIAAAVQEAVKGARSLLSADVLEGMLRLDASIEIHDSEDRHLATIRFDEVVEIVGAEDEADEHSASAPH
jgi:hypothetical protein